MAQQNVVFSDNILLKGSWKADTAYSIWFDFKVIVLSILQDDLSVEVIIASR